MTATIVILGGYGVFGGKLARRLALETDHHVIIAGRNVARARAFCAVHGGEPASADRDDPDGISKLLIETGADIIVDASGPFDVTGGTDPYHVARAAIDTRCHYIDLADNAAFVGGIATLDDAARAAGIAVISGVSSVPCLSSAAVDALASDFATIDTIDMAILPGNRAPRGRAVVESILGQAGKPFSACTGGTDAETVCWGTVSRRRLAIPGVAPLPPRWQSPIEVPDHHLFPAHYGARTVRFFAGLELPLMHLGLWALTWLVRTGLVRSLRPLAAPLLHIARWLERFGTDRGGMDVLVTGTDRNGRKATRLWTLIAEQGDGPEIPATPARALIDQLIDARIEAGARPAIGVLTLAEIEKHFAPFAIRTAITASQSRNEKSGSDFSAADSASPQPSEIFAK